jgi:hypothetical protein
VRPQNHATFESDTLDTVQKRSSPDDDETLLTETSWFIKAHTSLIHRAKNVVLSGSLPV